LAPFGPAVSEEKIFLTLANQKQELPLAAIFDYSLKSMLVDMGAAMFFLAHLTQRVM
jgi:hypothetical protein